MLRTSLALLCAACSTQVTVDPPCVESVDSLAARAAVARAWDQLLDEDVASEVLEPQRVVCRDLASPLTGKFEDGTIVVDTGQAYDKKVRVVAHEVIHSVLGQTTGDPGGGHVGSWREAHHLVDGLASQLLDDWGL